MGRKKSGKDKPNSEWTSEFHHRGTETLRETELRDGRKEAQKTQKTELEVWNIFARFCAFLRPMPGLFC